MAKETLGRVGIVGLGLIGGSVGLGLSAGVADEVVGYDRSPEVAGEALSLGCVGRLAEGLDEVGQCDLIVLAVPPTAVISALQELGGRAKPSAVLTDVAGVKGSIVEAVPPSLAGRFVPGHPMAGTEFSGPRNARSDLFQGAVWVLCPPQGALEEAVEAVREMVVALGAGPVLMTAADHDRHAAVLSHLPHVLASMMLVMSEDLAHPELGAGSWKDLTRVGGAEPSLWADILLHNRDVMIDAMGSACDRLQGVREALESRDRSALEALFRNAGRVKERRS